jgi:hypothetical protein
LGRIVDDEPGDRDGQQQARNRGEEGRVGQAVGDEPATRAIEPIVDAASGGDQGLAGDSLDDSSEPRSDPGSR